MNITDKFLVTDTKKHNEIKKKPFYEKKPVLFLRPEQKKQTKYFKLSLKKTQKQAKTCTIYHLSAMSSLASSL